MTAPTSIPYWGRGIGANVVTGLVPTSATVIGTLVDGTVTYRLLRYAFSGSPTLSGVLLGHRLTITGFANTENNGIGLFVQSADNTGKTITVRVTDRLADDGLDETGVTGSGLVVNSGANLKEPGAAKQLQGWIPGEKPGAGWLNWWMHETGEWIGYLATGGANVFRTDVISWQAVTTRENQGLEWVIGLGAFRFDPDATDAPGEGVLQASGGSGRAFMESAHPDALMAALAAMLPEILPAVTATLSFGSTAQSAISTATITVPGAQIGDDVSIGAPSTLEAGFIWSGFVSAENTVTIRLAKITTGTVTPAAASWTVRVTRPNSMPVITVIAQKIYLRLIGGAYADGAALNTDLALGDNESHFRLLINSKQHRRALLDDAGIAAIIAASTLADTAVTDSGGY